jgi:hypothetical protein
VGALRMVRGLSLCQLSHEFMCMGLGQWLDGLCVQIRGQYLCVSSCLQLDPNVVSNPRARCVLLTFFFNLSTQFLSRRMPPPQPL